MIPFYDIKRVIEPYQDKLKNAAASVIESGKYVLGKELKEFESEFPAILNSSGSCVGVGSGYDAIKLILRSWLLSGFIKEGDEVLVPSNTFVATALAVRESNLKPVFVEPNSDTHLIDELGIMKVISYKTKVIIPVHLYGQMVDMDYIAELAKERDLLVLEDAAQAHGASFKGKPPGSFGFPAAFSFYPAKNLGALGDGGAILSDDQKLIKHLQKLRNYGSVEKYNHEEMGINSRLDEIQASFLNVRLKFFRMEILQRKEIATRYLEGIKNPKIELPGLNKNTEHGWHLFVIKTENRDDLKSYLLSHQIETLIHYPVDLRNNDLFGDKPIDNSLADHILSLPLFPNFSIEEQLTVIKVLNEY